MQHETNSLSDAYSMRFSSDRFCGNTAIFASIELLNRTQESQRRDEDLNSSKVCIVTGMSKDPR